MILDTSVFLAILQEEPERRRFTAAPERWWQLRPGLLSSVCGVADTRRLDVSRTGLSGTRDSGALRKSHVVLRVG